MTDTKRVVVDSDTGFIMDVENVYVLEMTEDEIATERRHPSQGAYDYGEALVKRYPNEKLVDLLPNLG